MSSSKTSQLSASVAGGLDRPANIAGFLPLQAAAQPYAPAIIYPYGRDTSAGGRGKVSYTHYTYRQLDEHSDLIARGLREVGIGRGVLTALMVKPSLEFFALTFGIFKAGAVPVMIDPGIGLKSLKICLAEAAPKAFIGIPAAHVARMALGWARGSIEHLVTVGRRLAWGGHTLAQIKALGAQAAERDDGPAMADVGPEDLAAILFTSGSTGVPKGVVYRHRHFTGQVDLIRELYGIQPGEVDLPTFPLFALFDPALGMTTVVPDMDFRKPAEVDPKKVVEAIHDFGVTNMFGSPALLNTVGRHGASHGVRLPTLKRVISAGAPVPATVMQRFLEMLPDDARIHTPYGATECLPVASISSAEVLSETSAKTDEGAGVCVGRMVEPNLVRIIAISDAPIAEWDDALLVEQGSVGEIVVKGPTATDQYYNREASTELAKIREGETVCHRMGDLGYFDEHGRLWFCGRKSHRVQTPQGELYTVPCEGVFNTHPGVYRSALVGVDGRPVVCVELEAGANAEKVRVELAEIGARHPHTASVHSFLVHPGFPVDIRHNAKIGRPALAEWARGRL